MRTLVRLILILVIVAVVGIWLGLWPAGTFQRGTGTGPAPLGTNGTIDTDRARERGAEIGEKAAVATQKLQETIADATLTTKIKAKIALDDTLKARTIDVSSNGSTVTISGEVPTVAAHDRALSLARETAGVSVVIDHLAVAGR